MKYSELVKIRAEQLYKDGILTFEEYAGKGRSHYNPNILDKELHLCWYSICTDDRLQHYKCEECGAYDPERKPLNE